MIIHYNGDSLPYIGRYVRKHLHMDQTEKCTKISIRFVSSYEI